MFGELKAVIGMASEANRLATGYQVELDEQFKTPCRGRRTHGCLWYPEFHHRRCAMKHEDELTHQSSFHAQQ